MDADADSFSVTSSDIDQYDHVFIGPDDVSNYNDDQILPEAPETIEKIRKWLEPTDYNAVSGEYRRHLTSRASGTGSWLPDSEPYRRWHDSQEHGLLWIRGVPGSGKSVFAASLTDSLSQEGTPVLFFFFRQIIEANHRPVNMLRDWLSQILEFSPPLQVSLKEHLDACRGVNTLSEDALWRHLRSAMAQLPKVYCVVDALDEMDADCVDFVKSLAGLGRWRPGQVKVLMTSRPNASLENLLRHSTSLHLRLQAQFVDVDIVTYVLSRLATSSISEPDRDLIKEAVPGRANGLFLYARLALDAFLEPGAQISEVIANLPLDLNALYASVLIEHSKRSGYPPELQLTIVRWVTHATRPLRLLELADLLGCTDPSRKGFDTKANKQMVREACGPLLGVLPDETISVVHHTLTEFLVGRTRSTEEHEKHGFPVLQPAPTHREIAKSCLSYISCAYEDISDSTSPAITNDSLNDCGARKVQRPCLGYALTTWYRHAKYSAVEGEITDSLLEQIKHVFRHSITRTLWMQQCLPRNDPGAKKDLETLDVHIAAYCGLMGWLIECLQRKDRSYIDVADQTGRTPIWWAAANGQDEAVHALLLAGADPARFTDQGYISLHVAAENGHYKVVSCLLEAGVSATLPATHNRNGRTAKPPNGLTLASQNGHFKVVEVFLPFIDNAAKQRALHIAARLGFTTILRMILQEPNLDPNSILQDSTPLLAATTSANLDSMQALVEAGADATVGRLYTQTRSRLRRKGDQERVVITTPDSAPLHTLCALETRDKARHYSRTHMEADDMLTAFGLLLRAGADVNQRDRSGRTPLHVCCTTVMIKLLLEAGAESHMGIFLKKPSGLWTDEFSSLLSLLTNAGADVNERDAGGQTPLMYAVHDLELLGALLEFGADCRLTDHQQQTALHHFYDNKISDLSGIVPALLRAGADVNARAEYGDTALHYALRQGNAATDDHVEVLIDAGADVNARNSLGEPIVFEVICQERNPGDIIKQLAFLKELSASLLARDMQGRTLLHVAVSAEYQRRVLGKQPADDQFDALVEYLCAQGLSVEDVDFRGNGLFHELVYHRKEGSSNHRAIFVDLCVKLKAMGADPSLKNNAGMTPLHVVCHFADSERSRSKNISSSAIEWFVGHTESINAPDKEGIRPIHFAIANCCHYVEMLLDLGADTTPVIVAYGSVLHIAIRCAKWNTLGLLVEDLKTRQPAELASLINCVDAKGFTVIHYACRSGMPAVVSMLLAAGADPRPSLADSPGRIKQMSDDTFAEPIVQCVLGVREHRYKLARQIPQDLDRLTPVKESREIRGSKGIRRRQKQRRSEQLPRFQQDKAANGKSRSFCPSRDTSRCREIFDMLLARGARLEQWVVLELMESSARDGDDYITDGLMQLYRKLFGDDTSEPFGLPVVVSQARWQAEQRTLKESLPFRGDGYDALAHMIQLRQYDVIRDMRMLGMDFTKVLQNGTTALHLLVAANLWELLDQCCTPEEAQLMDDVVWRTEASLLDLDPEGLAEFGSLKPLLMTAAGNAQPSLQTMKVLVEKKGVNVNAQLWSMGPQQPAGRLGESALHILAGGPWWWQAGEAIPYLTSVGANVDIRDGDGDSSLHRALQSNRTTTNRAGRTLVQLGADVNAVNHNGKTPLSHAGGELQLARLLLAHGAAPDRDTIVKAIKSLSTHAVEIFVSADSAKAQEDSHWRGLPRENSTARDIPHSGLIHPLWAASDLASVGNDGCKNSPIAAEMMEILLRHGASPSDTFYRPLIPTPGKPLTRHDMRAMITDNPLQKAAKASRNAVCTPGLEGLPIYQPRSQTQPRGLTVQRIVLHEIFYVGGMSQPIFDMCNDLDLEVRDRFGRTALLAFCASGQFQACACEHHKDFLKPLRLMLERGADVRALTNAGHNALHLIAGGPMTWNTKLRAMELLGDKVASLAEQEDVTGYKPWHYLLTQWSPDVDRDMLEKMFACGIDPLALDFEGNTALHYTIRYLRNHNRNMYSDHIKPIIRLLTRHGLDVNARNLAGEPPLLVMWRGHTTGTDSELDAADIGFLDRLGVDFAARSNNGLTALHETARVGSAETYELIRATERVDPFVEDEDGRTSLDVAAHFGKKSVLKLFEGVAAEKWDVSTGR